MLRISKLTDYGVVLVTHLVGTGSPLSAQELSGITSVPLPTTKKVLKQLCASDVVTSTRGVYGGYSLARDASEISVAEVITALEGPIAVTECSTPRDEDAPLTDESCEHETNCGVRTNWQRINAAVYDALDAISIREMVADAPLITLFRSREAATRGAHGSSS